MTRTSRPLHSAPAPVTPRCLVCTTPVRCGTAVLHDKGPRCAGKDDGPDDCDCLNECGDDPWLGTGKSRACQRRREAQERP